MTAVATFLLAAVLPLADTTERVQHVGVFPGDEQTVTGLVVDAQRNACVVVDESRRYSFYNTNDLDVAVGEIVIIRHRPSRHLHGGTTLTATSVRKIGRGTVPPPRSTTIETLLRGEDNLLPVRVRGTICDIAEDEVDETHLILLMRSGNASLSIPVSKDFRSSFRDFNSLLHAEVEVTGICFRDYPTIRFYKGPVFMLRGNDAVRIVHPAQSDIFDNPPIPFGKAYSPEELIECGLRTAVGTVAAVWGRNNLLLTMRHDNLLTDGVPVETHHRVELPDNTPLPPVGSVIRVAGQVETDTYHINLSQACWRSVPGPSTVPKQVPLSVKDLSHVFDVLDPDIPFVFGDLIRFTGTVSSLPRPGTSDGRMRLCEGGSELAIDVSACPDVLNGLLPGCKLEITGVRLFEIDNWRPNAPRPKIQSRFVALRSPDDVVVLSRPSWWTNGRLMALVAGLLTLLAGVLVWNRSLNRLALKRGRELANEQIERSLSELKVDERTRLAVELHDSLSQNLAGVACQVGALKNVLGRDPSAVQSRVRTVERMLQSTRSELRNCLFDLRSNVMDDPDMANAIRHTLDEAEIDAEVSVRFDVPREKLLDSTAHAILSIVRELAGNAVRHGHATRIRVAGSIDNGHLLFSVRDNGCGFDPDTAPGLSDGHFGLDGIRNRASGFNGTFTVSSSPGRGTRAVVDIPLPPSFLNDTPS